MELDPRALRGALAKYQRPSWRRSIYELLVTAVPLAAIWLLAAFAARHGWWWGLLLSVPAACFLVRLFMIQHDCGHGSFFPSRRANAAFGAILGVLTMTPYGYWRWTHAIHHATSGNLDRRWLGAVETLTIDEFRALSPLRRLGYSLYRNPLVMFGLGPSYMFLLQHRLPIGLMKEPAAWRSVIAHNLGLASFATVVVLIGGFKPLLSVHLPMVVLAGSIGMWLFYIQHQFDGAFWARQKDWTLDEASLRGSSYLDLPPVLRWLTANIGAHHVHHLGSKIPFYRLPQVLKDHAGLKTMRRIRIGDTVRAMRLALWDEANSRLVTFRDGRRAAALGGVGSTA